MKEGEKLGLDGVLEELKLGLNFAQISKKFGIPKQTLSYSKDKLEKLGCIEKTGYGTWRVLKQVPIRPKGSMEAQNGTSLKPIRGHAFIWTISFPGHKYEWMQIIENYKRRFSKPKQTFNLICNKRVVRTIFKNRKIWLTKNGLVIYEPLEFFERSSFQARGTAVYEMDLLIKDLLEELGQPFHTYFFNCSREHFANVKNMMAHQFNEAKIKIKVEYNGKNFWIDHSDGVDEEETDDAKLSVQAHKKYESDVKNEFKVTADFVLEGFAKQQEIVNKTLDATKKGEENMQYLDKNLKTHFAVLESLKEQSAKQTEILERLLKRLEKGV